LKISLSDHLLSAVPTSYGLAKDDLVVEPVISEIEAPETRARLCGAILRSLPEWFGIESAIEEYVREVRGLPALGAELDGEEAGFLALKLHSPHAAEIYVMGVRREVHGRGVGTALIGAAEAMLRSRSIEYLQVKTLGPSRPSEHYARTRRFYEVKGFRRLEELHGLWSEGNPTLVLVKRL
jgi:GNAT superfamily N-acetyltransferase